jgi:tRNA/rRNA methyltransferase/tRNA (cytidine32/uridine32-2'-O)-methyltransferase
MNQDDVVIVLSRPEEAGNVGAVCRAMKNMGLSRLRLAASDFGGNEAVIRARAVHAGDIWEQAETFASLGAAVADCAMVIGTTRRRGRHRKQVSMTPSETAVFLQSRPGPAALVFGNERTGLEDDELELCNFASHIPVDEAFPSLNLSHAVQVYAYEIFKVLGGTESPASTEAPPAVKGQWVPMDQTAIADLVKEVTDNLLSLGFYRQRGREEQELFFRDIFSRSALTEREGRYFGDIIAKAARLAGKGDKEEFNQCITKARERRN